MEKKKFLFDISEQYILPALMGTYNNNKMKYKKIKLCVLDICAIYII